MKTSKDFAAIWRQKISQAPTVEREFAGLPCVARRLSLFGWAQAGKLPQFLVEMLFRQTNRDVEIKQGDIAPEEFEALMKVQKDVVCEVLVDPQVVTEDRELKDGEISYADLVMNRPDVVTEIITWSRAGCPDVPVATTNGGKTAVAAVENFRKGRRRRATSGARSNVRTVSETAPE